MRSVEPLVESPRMLRLQRAIRGSWSADTSADPDWSPRNPALGQCAVTSLVLQDYYPAATLVRAMVGDVSHYWVRLDAADVDLTRGQFTEFHLSSEPEARERSYVLGFPETVARYNRLRGRVRVAMFALGL